MTEAGQEPNLVAGKDEIAVATSQGVLALVLKMFYSNVKKLDAYAASKTFSKEAIREATSVRSATSSHLVAVKAYFAELDAGKDAVLMRSLPLRNNGEGLPQTSKEVVLPNAVACSICCSAFLFGDIILCFCQHVYHPWCASHWFERNVTCAVPKYGFVPKTWYTSFGFGQYDDITIAEGAAYSIHLITEARPDVPTSMPSTMYRGIVCSSESCICLTTALFCFLA